MNTQREKRNEIHEARKAYDREQLTIGALREVQKAVHQTAREKGWWEERDLLVKVAKEHSEELGEFARVAIEGLNIALAHSELSEALEAIRTGNGPDDKIPAFSGAEAEKADTIIRLLDSAEASGQDVIGAMFAKAAMNKTRSFKHGGKTC